MTDFNKQSHTHTHTHTHTDSTLDIPIFTKLYEFYKEISQILVLFPKTKRYTLGQKLDNTTLDIMELLFSVPVCANKILVLQRISVKVDLLKILLRLSKDSLAMQNKDYIKLETILAEIGRMLGGWIRSTKQNTP